MDTLYIHNLHSAFSAGDLRKMFSLFGSIMDINKNVDFASVRFHHSEHCMRAARDIDKRRLGNDVEITFHPNNYLKT